MSDKGLQIPKYTVWHGRLSESSDGELCYLSDAERLHDKLQAEHGKRIIAETALKALIQHSKGINADGHTRVAGDDIACLQNYERVLAMAKAAIEQVEKEG